MQNVPVDVGDAVPTNRLNISEIKVRGMRTPRIPRRRSKRDPINWQLPSMASKNNSAEKYERKKMRKQNQKRIISCRNGTSFHVRKLRKIFPWTR